MEPSTPRSGKVERNTKETQISLELILDGQGSANVKMGVPFLEHMLTLFSVHGLFDLHIAAQGDLYVDAHHTVEDVGICLGVAFDMALGDRAGIRRYGSAIIPMDETRALVALDLSKRPYLMYQVPKLSARVGQFETELIPEFFRAFCQHGGVTLHVEVACVGNTHHMIEAVFKAFGRALDEAVRIDERRSGIPSSKGAL